MQSKYAKGIFYNERRENAPTDLIGSIAISKANFMEWLSQAEPDERGYIKLDMWKGEYQGKPNVSFALNTYKKSDVPF